MNFSTPAQMFAGHVFHAFAVPTQQRAESVKRLITELQAASSNANGGLLSADSQVLVAIDRHH
jgi:hypothetical protein